MESVKGYLSLPTVDFYYEVAGEGEPLLLIHGIDSDCRMWDPQFFNFARYFKTIRFDLRGFGKTAMPAEEFQILDDIQQLLTGLGIENAHIIGYSYGGTIAPAFALKYPESVKSLTLAGAGMIGHTWSEEVSRYFVQFQESIKNNDFNEMMRLLCWKSIYGPKRKPEGLEEICGLLKEMFLPVVKRGHEGKPLSPGDSRGRLSSIKVPTLILVGELDFEDYHQIADFYHQNIPNSIKKIIPNAAHFMNIENPKLFNEEVLKFLK